MPRRIAQHRPASPINTTTASSGTLIETGFNFNEGSGRSIKIYFVDQAAGQTRQWSPSEIDVDQMMVAFNSNVNPDAFIHIYDNDWIRLNVVDPAVGSVLLQDQGRDMAYLRSELWEIQ